MPCVRERRQIWLSSIACFRRCRLSLGWLRYETAMFTTFLEETFGSHYGRFFGR